MDPSSGADAGDGSSVPPALSFIHDPSGSGGGWACPHCITLPCHLRAPGSRSVDPPSSEFMQHHFRVCSGLASSYGGSVFVAMGKSGDAAAAAGAGVGFDHHPPPASFHPPSHHQFLNASAPAPAWHHPMTAHLERSREYEEFGYSVGTSEGGGDEKHPGASSSLHQEYSPPLPPPPQPQPHYRHHHNVSSPHFSMGQQQQQYQPQHHHHYQQFHPQSHQQPHPQRLPQHQVRDAETKDASVTSGAPHHDEWPHYRRQSRQQHDDVVVLPEDKLLLSEFFYFLNQQLRLCKFTEADRKSRGRKRENIAIGYGGLECRHCAGEPGSRKFFWSNVDRFANSFNGIEDHVLRCAGCPDVTREALRDLKLRHREHVAKLPRGSQKVFFRRMWRRLHPNDDDAAATGATTGNTASGGKRHMSGRGVDAPTTAAAGTSPRPSPPSSSPTTEDRGGSASPEGTTTSRSPSPRQQKLTIGSSGASVISVGGNSPTAGGARRILLAIEEDRQWLSDLDCFVRRSLEVFTATEVDVADHRSAKRRTVKVGQVGVRCVYCAIQQSSATAEAAGGATSTTNVSDAGVSYPGSINELYTAVRDFKRCHLDECPNLPAEKRDRLARMHTSASLPSVLKRYYVIAASALGMHDTADGIRLEGGGFAALLSGGGPKTTGGGGSDHRFDGGAPPARGYACREVVKGVHLDINPTQPKAAVGDASTEGDRISALASLGVFQDDTKPSHSRGVDAVKRKGMAPIGGMEEDDPTGKKPRFDSTQKDWKQR